MTQRLETKNNDVIVDLYKDENGRIGILVADKDSITFSDNIGTVSGIVATGFTGTATSLTKWTVSSGKPAQAPDLEEGEVYINLSWNFITWKQNGNYYYVERRDSEPEVRVRFTDLYVNSYGKQIGTDYVQGEKQFKPFKLDE